MAGVAFGVAALIVVLSVMNGFYDVVRELLVSFDPHVRIESTDARGIENPDSLMALTVDFPGVVSATPFIEGRALLAGGSPQSEEMVVVRGLDPAALSVMDNVRETISIGDFDIDEVDFEAGAVISANLGNRFALYPGTAGSDITLLSAPAIERSLIQFPVSLPARQSFEVRGMYELQAAGATDRVFIGLEPAQRLFQMGDRVSGVDLRLQDLDRAASVQTQLQRQLDPERFTVLTWYDLQRSLYDVMRLEKWAASVILMLIVVVAAFNIVGSITMIVIEKRRDIGAIRAMGASQRDVRRIFLLEGLLVGGVGTAAGLVLGLALALAQQQFELVPLAGGEQFIISAYPVAIRVVDVVLVTTVSIGLCGLASLYPASRAAAIEPARAVQGGG